MIPAIPLIQHLRSRATWSAFAWRCFWLVMLVGHLPATLASLDAGVSNLPRIAILLLAQTLFVLKLLDVRWLRVRNCPRTWLAICVGVALLHAGAVTHDGAWIIEEHSWRTLSVAALSALSVALLLLISRHNAGPRCLRNRSRALWRDLSQLQLRAALPPRFLMLCSISIHRAPPR
jgi:hypothetical protein